MHPELKNGSAATGVGPKGIVIGHAVHVPGVPIEVVAAVVRYGDSRIVYSVLPVLDVRRRWPAVIGAAAHKLNNKLCAGSVAPAVVIVANNLIDEYGFTGGARYPAQQYGAKVVGLPPGVGEVSVAPRAATGVGASNTRLEHKRNQ
jgi:hypothetical protein